LRPGGGGSARMGASAHVWCVRVVSEGCEARGLQTTESEMRVRRRSRAHCRRVWRRSISAVRAAGACIAAAVGRSMRWVAGRVWSGVPRLRPGGGGSRLRSLVRALVAWLGVGFSRCTLYNFSAVRGALLLSLLNTLTLWRSCLHSQHQIEIPCLVPRCLSPVPIRTAPPLTAPSGTRTHVRAHSHARNEARANARAPVHALSHEMSRSFTL
jgi:hypothetical protein